MLIAPRTCWAAALLFLSAGSAVAQPAPITAGVEVRRDRVDYHFDNLSSFDTPELVPHFFEQHYVADNLWATVTARYRGGIPWETTAAITPERTASADDFDTFFNPDGTVWVSGTSGDALMRAVRVEQRAGLGKAGPVTLQAGYAIRWDRAEFLLGHKLVIRNGTIVESFDTNTRETTHTWTQHVFVAASLSKPLDKAWRIELEGDVSPTTIARLGIELPDKYPGREISFTALAYTVSGQARVVRGPIAIGIDAGRTWGYDAASNVSRRLIGIRIEVRM